tara:strand:- start:458 stop:1681 length:1224 start_codon:yes stop_codon:yes gene_type:complete
MATEQKITYAPFVTPGMKALQTGQRAQTQFKTLADMARLQIAKDVALEDRAQERERLRLAAQQREMLKGARDKAQRRSTIGDITSLIGSGLGFVYGGGPAGAAAGGAAGRTLGTLFAQEGGPVPNFVPSPTGKFKRSGYEQLVRDQEYLIDLEKAIQKAQKPTAGTLLGAAAKGYQTGMNLGEFLEGDFAQGIFKKGKEKLDAFKLSRQLAKMQKNPMESYYKKRGTEPIQTTGFMEEGQLFEGPPVDYSKLAGDVAGEIKGRIGEVGQTIPGRIEAAKQSFGFIEDAISKNKSKQAKKRLDKLPQNTEQAVVQYLAGQKNPNQILSNLVESGSNALQDFIVASRQPRRQIASGASTLKDFLYVSPQELGLSRSVLETYPSLFMNIIAPNRNRSERMIERSQTAGFR